MVNSFPALATNFFNYLIVNNLTEAANFAHLVKANSKDGDDFYKKVNYFWTKGDPASKSTAIWMLVHGRHGDTSLYKEPDFDYFEEVLAEQNQSAIGTLKYGIEDYLVVAPKRTLELIASLFKLKDSEPLYDSIFYSMFENVEVVEKNAEAIKEFIFKQTVEIPLDHYMQDLLKFLENHFGFDTVVDYLLKKANYFEAHPDRPRSYYDFVFSNPKLDQETREYNFIQLLDRFIKEKKINNDGVIDVLKPATGVSAFIYEVLSEKIEQNRKDKDYLIDLAQLLHIFKEPTESHVKLLINIGNQLAANHTITDDELRSIFPDGYYYNMGSRSKSGQGPFPQDVEKKSMIEKLLAENQLHERLGNIFKNILIAVERDIKEESKSDDW
ncbi:hypothetical protein ABIC45_004223 [Mucilaginibacter rubeus]|uniref:hypothetical protein n=1 Tax=Mucilaginibacter rubeus TaxID=2027860 RepID=UPI003395EC00